MSSDTNPQSKGTTTVTQFSEIIQMNKKHNLYSFPSFSKALRNYFNLPSFLKPYVAWILYILQII